MLGVLVRFNSTPDCTTLCRLVAAHLASECGRSGYVHLAALLLHTSLGATMRQQYRLVLHTKLQQLQRAGRAAGADVEQQRSVLQAALSQLGEPLEEVLVCQLAGQGAAVPALPASQAAKGRRRAAAPAAPNPAPAQDLLAALDQQAEAALRRWMAALPEGTVVCSLGSAPSSSTSSSRDPGGASEHLVISRLATGAAPVILQLPAPEALAAGAAQHPIRALSLDPEDSAARSSSRWVLMVGGHRLPSPLVSVMQVHIHAGAGWCSGKPLVCIS